MTRNGIKVGNRSFLLANFMCGHCGRRLVPKRRGGWCVSCRFLWSYSSAVPRPTVPLGQVGA